MENLPSETQLEAVKKTNPYYEEALNHQYAIQHVLNDGANITGRMFYGFDNIDDMIGYAKKSGFGAEIHEITCNIGDRWQKLFFDIDAAQELVESSGTKFSRLIELILSSIRNVLTGAGVYLDDITRTILCGNRPGKYSAMITKITFPPLFLVSIFPTHNNVFYSSYLAFELRGLQCQNFPPRLGLI